MLDVAIVGAGIGGLTTALGLRRLGVRVTVYEQAKQLGEIGAGITLATEACQVINWLGLADELEALERPTPHIGTLHFETAERLTYEVRDVLACVEKHGTATRHLHRADLHRLLANAVERVGDTILVNHQLMTLRQDSDSVELVFASAKVAKHDLLIGCDGLKSVVRDQCFETEKPSYTGMVAWRGLVDRKKVSHIAFDPHFAAVPARGKMFARYPIRRERLINYVAIARQSDIEGESWTSKADLDTVLAHFDGWHSDFVDVIAATNPNQCLQWALRSRQPLDSWVNHRVVLLGDAAHPMTPFYGRGAMMAIEDACVMTRCFERGDTDWEDALQRYQRARLERANAIHVMSLDRGNAYLSKDRKERAQPIQAGLGEHSEYNALTVTI